MKLPIKVGSKTYYIDSKEVEQEKQFRKNKEIEFIRNTRKLWNNIMTRQEHNREASSHATCNWVEVRNQAAIAAMQGTIAMLNNSNGYAFRKVVVEGFSENEKTYPNEIAEFAIACADALVKQLKEG